MVREIKLPNGKIIKIKRATPAQQNSAETRSLRYAAKIAGEIAVSRTFAQGLPITIGRNGKLIHVFPDGHEEIIGELRKS